MSITSASIRPHARAAAQQPIPPSRAELMQRCQGFLLTIAELGTELTREVQQQAIAQAAEEGPDATAIPDTWTKSLERAALAVRRTVLLIDKLRALL